VAVADAQWVGRSLDPNIGLGELLASAIGLCAPLALALGVLIGAASWFVHPRAEPSASRLVDRLREVGAGRPADIAAFAPLAALGVFAWATASAHLARKVLDLPA